ncbi:hypothetical protein BC830DRAFT_871588 [Chytriomyces sp. MP71]|nr:hypothetical protein BC830DRAFT_871588 [Chytriomyces sp. MP71]
MLMQLHAITVAYPNRPPPVVFALASDSRRLIVTGVPYPFSPMDILNYSHGAIMNAFANTKVHCERLIYCLAGTIFYPWSPLPFGGPKTAPGYASFSGVNAMDVLHYILTESFFVHWHFKGRGCLDFVAASINEVLALQYRGNKDELDERMLKGMKKAGHIRWQGQNVIPAYLSHLNEDGAQQPPTVEFTPLNILRYRTNLKEQQERTTETIDRA